MQLAKKRVQLSLALPTVTLKLCMNYTVVIIFEFRGPDRVITAKLSLSEEKIRANAFLAYR